MLISMTGFGRAETELPGAGRAVVEIRSVNHRFLEVDCRMPEGLQAFEEAVRALAGRKMLRGQVRVSVAVKGSREAASVIFQPQVARRYLRQLESFRRQLKVEGPVTLGMLLALPQVMAVAERNDFSSAAVWKRIERAVGQALDGAVRMRQREGARLEKALRHRIDLFEQLNNQIRQRVPVVQKGLQERLADRIQTALRGVGREVPQDQERLVLTEAAALVQATDVSEELERIESHLTALRKTLAGQPAGASGSKRGEQTSPGRTFDFLAQELQREVNTLGTKLRDGTVGRWVVEFKGQIEKLREQAANIE